MTAGLYIVATPIGNRGDITLRALSVLSNADIICCEDTRTSLKLLNTFEINKTLWSYHEHNAQEMRPRITQALHNGKVIALISDAGMPLISDPGYKLVRECYENRLPITTVPGASAVISGLVLSGMPTDRFMFCGFAQAKEFTSLKNIPATLIFFEAPTRLLKCLKLMQDNFADREVAVVREITKRFEEVKFGSYSEVIFHYSQKFSVKGEFVIVLSPPQKIIASETEIDQTLALLLQKHSVKEASQVAAEMFGIARKQIYKRALLFQNDH